MSLANDVRETIRYARSFGGRLTLRQLHFRLLSDKKYSRKEIINIIKNYQLRIKNEKTNKENDKKIELARELVNKHLSKFKDILMVGVTGSVAAENAKKEEDIDLFIICRADSLWWTRLRLRLYIKLKGIPHRRYGQRENPNDFCFNLWMDELDLVVPIAKQNQKNAVDLILMKVLFNRNQAYERFILDNGWVRKYVANGHNQIKISNLKFKNKKSKTGIISSYLNYVAFIGQLVYMRLKGPVKFINLRQAFFHK